MGGVVVVGVKVCRNCGGDYATAGYKYCDPCRPMMGKAQSLHWGRKKRSLESAERKADRPWTLRASLVCWLERECSACGQQKPRSAYKKKCAKSPDGLEAICLECNSRRNTARRAFATEETRAKWRAQMRVWNATEAGRAARAARPKPPEYEHSYRRKRLERMAQQDDGTVTSALLRKEFARTKCPYCAAPMQTKDKQLDHMHPLALGGLHSAVNVLVCCASCNGRKSCLPYVNWLSRLEPKQQALCRALWVKRYSVPPEQAPMLLADPNVVMRKVESLKQRETRQAIAEAKRARAAWFKRDAPDEWMAAWYEASGKPWRNPRLTDGQSYRLQYQHDPAYRAKERERSRRFKQRKPRVTISPGVRVHMVDNNHVS